MSFQSYAQKLEDIYINRCFGDRNQGFFIDVGASSPVMDNLTYAFYLKGWRGVNIEPIPERFTELERIRPHDVNVQAILGAEPGRRTLFRTPGIGGMSTVSEAAAKAFELDPKELDQLPVDQLTLRDICADFAPYSFELLKIDVEGAEKSVLEGADFSKWRPELIVVEAVSPLSLQPTHQEWEHILTSVSYRAVFDDGINRYYLRAESAHLEAAFGEPVEPNEGIIEFSKLGNPLFNVEHPDHKWATTFSTVVLRSIPIESDDWLMSLFTSEISPELLDSPPNAVYVDFCYWRILARAPSSEELAMRDLTKEDHPATLRDLISSLIQSDEFRMRRGRSSVRES